MTAQERKEQAVAHVLDHQGLKAWTDRAGAETVPARLDELRTRREGFLSTGEVVLFDFACTLWGNGSSSRVVDLLNAIDDESYLRCVRALLTVRSQKMDTLAPALTPVRNGLGHVLRNFGIDRGEDRVADRDVEHLAWLAVVNATTVTERVR